ncbi:hypothetical protein C8F01DRAFT_1144696, partial [Mycena amicta]
MSNPNLVLTYGAIYIGVLFATFLQGILSVQAYIYYERFPKDSAWLKSLVAVVWTIDFAHLVLVAYVPWHTLVINWGNPAIFLTASTELAMQILLVALPTMLCQMFYLHRLWLFSKNNIYLVSLLGSASLTVFALDFYLAIQTTESAAAYLRDTAEISAMFGLGAATDLCIALALVYYLRRGVSDMAATNHVISRSSTTPSRPAFSPAGWRYSASSPISSSRMRSFSWPDISVSDGCTPMRCWLHSTHAEPCAKHLISRL